MDVVMATVFFAELEDEPRLKGILQVMIKKKELKNFPEFSQESRDKQKRSEHEMIRQKKASEEIQEKEEKSKKSSNDLEVLQLAISGDSATSKEIYKEFLEALGNMPVNAGTRSSKANAGTGSSGAKKGTRFSKRLEMEYAKEVTDSSGANGGTVLSEAKKGIRSSKRNK